MTDQEYAERIIRIGKIVFSTVAVSLLFTFGGYFWRSSGTPRFDTRYVLQDTMPAMKRRAEIGACVGLILGVVVAFKKGDSGKWDGGGGF